MAEEEAKKLDAVEAPEAPETAEPETFAKSGKKSKKHIEEVKAEEERQARKAERAAKEGEEKPKGAKPVTRPRIERRGKKYQEVYKLVEKGKTYSLKDAIALAINTNPTKFDASIEAQIGRAHV